MNVLAEMAPDERKVTTKENNRLKIFIICTSLCLISHCWIWNTVHSCKLTITIVLLYSAKDNNQHIHILSLILSAGIHPVCHWLWVPSSGRSGQPPPQTDSCAQGSSLAQCLPFSKHVCALLKTSRISLRRNFEMSVARCH